MALLAASRSETAPASAICEIGAPFEPGTYNAGAYRVPGVVVGGVYANIWNYPSPGVGINESSGQYVRIENNPGTLWAQIGWEEWVSRNYERFRATKYSYKQSSTSSGVAFFIYPQPVNRFSYYTVLHNRQDPGTVTFQINGNNVLAQSGFRWLAQRGEAYGETNNLSAQMPGGYQNQSHFWDANIWYNNAWRAFNGAITFLAPYNYAWGGGTAYDIEDLRCP